MRKEISKLGTIFVLVQDKKSYTNEKTFFLFDFTHGVEQVCPSNSSLCIIDPPGNRNANYKHTLYGEYAFLLQESDDVASDDHDYVEMSNAMDVGQIGHCLRNFGYPYELVHVVQHVIASMLRMRFELYE